VIVVEPYDIIGGLLTSSNIPMPDATAGEIEWTADTYPTGTRRIMSSTRLLYEVVAVPHTNDQPDVGAAKAVPTWVVVSYVNRYKMFDQVNSSQSTHAAPVVVEITSPKGFNSALVSDGVDVVTLARLLFNAQKEPLWKTE